MSFRIPSREDVARQFGVSADSPAAKLYRRGYIQASVDLLVCMIEQSKPADRAKLDQLTGHLMAELILQQTLLRQPSISFDSTHTNIP